MPLMRVRILVIGFVIKTADTPRGIHRQRFGKTLGLELNDVESRAVGETHRRVRAGRAGERGSVGPHGGFQIVLRILTARRERIEVKTVAGTDHIAGIQ